jgi:hypothetical protein
LGLSWSLLLEADTSAQPMRPRSLDTAPDDYLACLRQDLLSLSQQPNPHTWHECSAVPVFWLKYSRLLTAFKFYFWFRVFCSTQEDGRTFPLFAAQWGEKPQVSKLLDQSKDILRNHQTIPGWEIWSRHMFDRIISRIRYIQDIEGFADKGMARHLLEEVRKVAQYMERMAREGNKSPDGSGGGMTVYENHTFAPGNMLLGRAVGNRFLYIDVGYPDFMRYDNVNLVEERITRFHTMVRHMDVISNSERNCNAFFRGIYENIDHQAKLVS